MAYIYVKSGGTATGTAGVYTEQKTGTWATAFTATNQYYGNIYNAIYQVRNTGDIIFVSSSHNFTTNTAGHTQVFPEVGYYRFGVICVSDTNIVSATTGAKETYTSFTGGYYYYLCVPYMYGVHIQIPDVGHFRIPGYSNQYPWMQIFDSCTFTATGNSSYGQVQMLFGRDTGAPDNLFINCTFNLGTSTTTYSRVFATQSGGSEGSGSYSDNMFIRCTFQSFTSSSATHSIYNRNGSASSGYFLACDFNACNKPLFSAIGDPSYFAYNATTSIILDRCREGSNNRTFVFDSQGSNLSKIQGFIYGATNLFLYRLNNGTAEGVTSIYRNDGAEYVPSSFYSVVLKSGTSISSHRPLLYKLTDLLVDTTINKTFTLEIAQNNAATALTTEDIYVDIFFDSGSTPKHNLVSSKIPYNLSPSNLATSSVTWTGLTNPTKQYISVTTNETGKLGLCTIYIYLKKASSTVYVCPKPTIS